MADLCTSISEEFDVASDVCTADVARILTSLHEEGLVEIVG